MDEKKYQYTIYKIKSNVQYENIYKKDISLCWDGEIELGTNTHKFKLSTAFENTPEWLRDISQISATTELNQKTSSTGAALEVIINDTDYFIFTFGTKGRHFINTDVIEERFGLICSLNLIEDNPIRQISKTTMDSNNEHSKEQLSKEGDQQEFGINKIQDVLKGVTGTPKNRARHKKVSGSDSLTITTLFGYEELNELASELNGIWQKKTYKERFDWIDKFNTVKDKEIIKVLENNVEKWLTGDLNECLGWITIPDAIDWQMVKGIAITGSTKRNELIHDIDIESLKQHWKIEDLTIEKLKSRRVNCVNDNDSEIKDYSWPVFKCLYFETSINESSYLLSEGVWYKVDDDYSKDLNAFYKNLNWLKIQWPEYDHKSETEYNDDLKKIDGFHVFDRQLTYSSNESAIEFCDVFMENPPRVIHIKRYGSSQVLSHLFAQGFVSAELMKLSHEFRKAILESDEANGIEIGITISEKPKENIHTIVYGIVSTSIEDEPNMPYFSKINLRSFYKRLDSMGYNVGMTKINYSEEAKQRIIERDKEKIKKRHITNGEPNPAVVL